MLQPRRFFVVVLGGLFTASVAQAGAFECAQALSRQEVIRDYLEKSSVVPLKVEREFILLPGKVVQGYDKQGEISEQYVYQVYTNSKRYSFAFDPNKPHRKPAKGRRNIFWYKTSIELARNGKKGSHTLYTVWSYDPNGTGGGNKAAFMTLVLAAVDVPGEHEQFRTISGDKMDLKQDAPALLAALRLAVDQAFVSCFEYGQGNRVKRKKNASCSTIDDALLQCKGVAETLSDRPSKEYILGLAGDSAQTTRSLPRKSETKKMPR